MYGLLGVLGTLLTKELLGAEPRIPLVITLGVLALAGGVGLFLLDRHESKSADGGLYPDPSGPPR